ncbi:MAG: hypothetical protein ACI9EW_001163 [Cellvibrionaceae bacterium]|jgi:hypothetical protein
MPYTVTKTTNYPHTPEIVYAAAKGAIEGLEGKLTQESPDQFKLVVKFSKTILGKVLGDRAWMQLEITAGENGSSDLTLTAYPLNAVGEKLMFGARSGALKTLVSWFYAHLQHRLPKTEG